MKQFSTRLFLITILLSVSYIVLHPKIANAQFKDVKADHSAYDAIMWASNEEIFKGYSNGTFRPNVPLTEAQFAKVVVNYFKLHGVEEEVRKYNFFEVEPAHWSDEYYNTLASYSAPLSHYLSSNEMRDKFVDRGKVALVLAHFIDTPSNLEESILSLINKGITTGQYPKYKNKDIERFFGARNNLTRGQMATFLYRMNKNGYVSIKGSNGEAKKEMYENAISPNLNTFAKEGMNLIPKTLIGDFIPYDKLEILESVALPYRKNIDLGKIITASFFNDTWKRFDKKSIEIFNKYNVYIEVLEEHSFKLGFDNGHFLNIGYDDSPSYSYNINLSYNAFTYDEMAYVYSIFTNSKVTGEKLKATENGAQVNFKEAGRELFYIFGSVGNLYDYSSEGVLRDLGHPVYFGSYYTHLGYSY